MSAFARRIWPAVFLAAGTVLFAFGVFLEKREEGEHGEGHEESILGIEPESTPLVILAVAVSLLLAVALWRSRSLRLVWVAVVFCAGFAVMDALEVIRTLDAEESGIAAIAAIVTVLHLAAALTALMLIRRPQPQVPGS